MGFLDRLFGRETPVVASPQLDTAKIVVGAGASSEQALQAYENSNITFNGELAGYDYTTILRNKQDNIVTLYQIADYYADADPIIRGIIEHVYVPYTTCSNWYLTGSKEKTYALFEEQYKKMRLKETLSGIAKELWKYNNVCCYLMDGVLITLPVHKWRIGNVTFNGTPIVEYDCQDIITNVKQKAYSIKETYVKDSDINTILKGYPEEIKKAVNANQQYAQLDPEYTFVLQGPKEGWMRYAIPFIAACLPALAKKELISAYETALLNVGRKSFFHAKYGESGKGQDILPDERQLNTLKNLIINGMGNRQLVVTNHLCDIKAVQADLEDLFQWNKYRDVNNDILSAGGVSGVIVSGISEDGSTFASAQVSMQTAETRINSARDEICEMMNKINDKLTEFIPNTYNLKEIPEFHFQPLSMEGKKGMREKCFELWQQGTVSTKTMMQTEGYSMEFEAAQREKESSEGIDDTLKPRETAAKGTTGSGTSGTGKTGRPKKDDIDRKSDPSKSESSKAPKPSNPDGSMGDDSG